MKDYDYKDNTLLHSVGLNFQRIESIFQNGIYSPNYALKNTLLNYSKNYDVEKVDPNYISCLKTGSIDLKEERSAYNIHTVKGISFIIEDVSFFDLSSNLFIHHKDEVLVKDYISTDKIKAIAIPEKYLTYPNNLFSFIKPIPGDCYNQEHVCNIAYNYKNFLESHNQKVDKEILEHYLDLLKNNKRILVTINNSQNFIYKKEYKNLVEKINNYLAILTRDCFHSKGIHTVDNAVRYLTNDKYEIYDIPKARKL